ATCSTIVACAPLESVRPARTCRHSLTRSSGAARWELLSAAVLWPSRSHPIARAARAFQISRHSVGRYRVSTPRSPRPSKGSATIASSRHARARLREQRGGYQAGLPGPLYCDTSALIKLYLSEPGSDEFNQTVVGRGDLLVSD